MLCPASFLAKKVFDFLGDSQEKIPFIKHTKIYTGRDEEGG